MSIRFFRVNEKFELWTTKMMKIMTMKNYSCCRLKRKKNLCVHCQRYQIQEVVKSLVRGISYKGCKQHQATSHINTYFLDLRFSPLNLNKIVGKKMPRCHHYFMIPQELLFWRWRKEQQQERRERNLHGCNNDACNLIISIFKAKLLTPISFRNFFLYKCWVILTFTILQTPNKSRKKCMQRILTLFYYILMFCFFLHYPNKCAKLFLPKLTVQVNN